jgi:hypothetical protein
MTRPRDKSQPLGFRAYATEKKAVAHELGHIFGLDDGDLGGAMDKQTYEKGPSIIDVQNI